MNCDLKNELYYVMPGDEEILSADFCIVYSVGRNGYQVVSKRSDEFTRPKHKATVVAGKILFCFASKL